MVVRLHLHETFVWFAASIGVDIVDDGRSRYMYSGDACAAGLSASRMYKVEGSKGYWEPQLQHLH